MATIKGIELNEDFVALVGSEYIPLEYPCDGLFNMPEENRTDQHYYMLVYNGLTCCSSLPKNMVEDINVGVASDMVGDSISVDGAAKLMAVALSGGKALDKILNKE